MLKTPLTDLAAWTRHFAAYDIPVMEATANAIAKLRERPERADAHTLADIALRDPLMALKVLVHTSRSLSGRLATPIETVTAGLVLTGIEPFFHGFGRLRTVEGILARNPEALASVRRVVERAVRASHLALGFAVHRQDNDAELLHQAALLDSFAELLMWCEIPDFVLDIQRRQCRDAKLRTAQVQEDVLHVNLARLEQALMAVWELPGVLCHLESRAGEPGPRSVALAVRIARHTALGWDNAALPDDFSELAHLLNVSTPAAREICIRLDS